MGYLPDSNDKNMRSGRPEQPKVSSKKLKKNEKAHDGVPKLLGEKFVRRSKIAVPKRRRGFQRCTASARGLYSDGEIRISAKRLSCPENARVPAVVSRASSCELSYPRKLPLGTLHFGETLEGSFSAVSTPIFATKYSFCELCSIFRDLQVLHSFAPLRIQKFCKLCQTFCNFLLQILQFLRILNQIRRFFYRI
jgi:hypothetical protein